MTKGSPLAALGRAYVREKSLSWYQKHEQKERESIANNERSLLAIDHGVPDWAKPLLTPKRYKGAFGGRSGGKSHFFAEQIVKRCVANPRLRVVGIREIQKSIKFSVKALIENKIADLGVSDRFEILTTEIRCKQGDGLIIFQGMQDHTADSIKSLEGFNIAWVEEAQRLSERSLKLLRPTIRAPGSEIWFSWNPDQPDDPVDRFFRGGTPPNESVIVQVNYTDNPHLPKESLLEMEIDRERDAEYYQHVWLGGYNTRSDLQIFGDKYRIQEFEPLPGWDGPYFGCDFGFGIDPTAAIACYIFDNRVWIWRESWALKLELDDTAERWKRDIPGIEKHVVRADSARPDTISFLRRNGIPRITGAVKGANSVKDGIEWLRSHTAIVVHPQCTRFLEECRLYRYKTNAAGDPLPEPQDKHNHLIDSLRYSCEPLIRASRAGNMTQSRAIYG